MYNVSQIYKISLISFFPQFTSENIKKITFPASIKNYQYKNNAINFDLILHFLTEDFGKIIT